MGGSIRLVPLDREGVTPLAISDRLRGQLPYFIALGEGGSAGLPEGEFRFDGQDIRTWLEDGVFEVVSPLDTANMTEIEISEEQEALLQWLHAHRIRHVRVESR